VKEAKPANLEKYIGIRFKSKDLISIKTAADREHVKLSQFIREAAIEKAKVSK
jgi:uncharacterized protein (DUF1778 family)